MADCNHLVRATRSRVSRTFNRGLVSRGIGEFPQTGVCPRFVYSNIFSLHGRDHLDNDRVVKEFDDDSFGRCCHRAVHYHQYTFRFGNSGHSFLKPVPLLNPHMVSPYNLEKFPKLLQQMTKRRLGNYVYPERKNKNENKWDP